ncbi:MAG: hypothetical protein M1401_12425 [Chloroflexi bacterium]|nr:hypothetical protein [Chloroflexota bacterium]MCL5109649.1 hypothetical protein [Chloroflexota bacterium]
MTEILGQGFNREELREELRRAEVALRDLHDERRATLGQTNLHIDSWSIKTLQEQFAGEEQRLAAQIAALKLRLAAGK